MRVLVDASVARAAGASPSASAPAPACVGALQALEKGGCTLVLNAAVKAEWDKHAGAFAKKWQGSMISRKRVAVVHGGWSGVAGLLSAAAQLPGGAARAVAKDAHVVEVAMVADLRVLSLDLAQRRYLCAIRSQVHGLSGLYWVSPVEDGVLDWLAKGAVDTPSLTLQGLCP